MREKENVRFCSWKENLFSVGGVPDTEFRFLGMTLSEHARWLYGAEPIDKFTDAYRYLPTPTVILRSSHTCLPRKGLDSVIFRAVSEQENIFFGSGWVIVDKTDLSTAKYLPLKGGIGFLGSSDISLVQDALRLEILKRFSRKGVIFESTEGVYIDGTVFIESGARISHDITITGKSLIRKGAYIKPYTIIEDAEIAPYAQIGPFVHVLPKIKIEEGIKTESFTEVGKSL